jgi:hypothetical protein
MRLARSLAATAGLIVAALAGPVPAALASGARPNHGPSESTSNPDVTVTPDPTAPGTATTFVVSCNSLTTNGDATAATLVGTSMSLPDQIPMQQSSQPNQFVVTVNMPQSIGPGSFSPTINCNNGFSQTVNIEVNAVPGSAPATGDGSTSTVTDGELTVAGLGLLGIAAVAGGLVLRSRASRGARRRLE